MRLPIFINSPRAKALHCILKKAITEIHSKFQQYIQHGNPVL